MLTNKGYVGIRQINTHSKDGREEGKKERKPFILYRRASGGKRQINRTPTKSPTQRECWLNQAKRPDSKSSNDSLGMLQGKRNR